MYRPFIQVCMFEVEVQIWYSILNNKLLYQFTYKYNYSSKIFITPKSKFQNHDGDNDHSKDDGKDPDEKLNYTDRGDDDKHM